MTEYLKLEKITENAYNVLLISNNKSLGTFIREVDGYFFWMPEYKHKGYYSDYALKELADKLHNLNLESKDL